MAVTRVQFSSVMTIKNLQSISQWNEDVYVSQLGFVSVGFM